MKEVILSRISVRSLLRGNLLLLFFLTPLVFYPWVTTFCITKQTVAQLLLLAAALLWTIWLLTAKGRPSLRSPLTLPIIAFAIACLISLTNSDSFYDSAHGLALWGGYILVYFIVISVVSKGWSKILLGASLLAGFLAAGYLIFQFYGVDFPFWLEIEGRGRLFSTFGNPNYVAGYLIGTLPLAFIGFISLKAKLGKMVLAGSIIVSYTAILMTYTRASWLGLLAAALLTGVLVAFYRGNGLFKRNRSWLVGLAAILLAITVVYSTENPLNWEGRNIMARAATGFDIAQHQPRLLIWRSAIEIGRQHPFIGAGIGTFGVNYSAAQGRVLAQENARHLIPQAKKSINAHNDPLHLFAETGIIGLFAAAWLIVVFYAGSLHGLRRRDINARLLLIGLMGGALAILFHSLFSFPFHIIPNGMLFWLFLGVSWVTIRKSRVESQESRHSTQDSGLRTQGTRLLTRKILRWFVLIPVIVVVLFLGMTTVRLFQADIQLKAGSILTRLGMFSEAVAAFEEAARLSPRSGRIQATLGAMYNFKGDHPNAILALNRARKNWVYHRLYNQLGYAYMMTDQMAEAKQAFEQSIHLFPNHAPAYLNLGNLHLVYAEKHLAAEEWARAEKSLDKAFFFYQQAMVFAPDLYLSPQLKQLAKDYHRLGLAKLDAGDQVAKVGQDRAHALRPFFAHDKRPVVDILTPLARPEEPILFKLFFYYGNSDRSPQGTLNIQDVEGKTVRELTLHGEGTILSAFLEEGLIEGDYVARVAITDEEGEIATTETWFTVIAEGRALIEIVDISIAGIRPWDPVVVDLTVKNQWNVPVAMHGVIEIRDGAGNKVGEIPIFSTVIPARTEEERQFIWQERRLDPGLYEVKVLIIYRDRVIEERAHFLVTR